MVLPVRDQLRYWGIAAAVFLVVLYFLGDVILPFVLGGAIAYLLDPIADRLQRAGMSRGLAVGVITVLAALIFVVVILLVLPTLINQAVALFNTAPQLFTDLRGFLTAQFPSMMDQDSVVGQSLATVGDTLKSKGGELLNTVLSSAASLINVIVLIFVVPVVAVYLLYDWDNLVSAIDRLLPRDHAPVIRQLSAEIDQVLASFIRGMGAVSLIIGAFAGLITFIPYVGSLVGGILAIGLGLFQFWGDWLTVGLIAAIFLFGQFIEGNFLTPRMVGSSVGLHPVWLIFSLAVFGALFGFVGLLVAVPVAAAIGVVLRYVIGRYTESRLYRGLDAVPDVDTPEDGAA
jgi:predicted PurR-regulated permease PerM